MAPVESLEITEQHLSEFKSLQKQILDCRSQELVLKGQLLELQEKRNFLQRQTGMAINLLLLEAGVKDTANYMMNPDFTKIVRKKE